MASRPLSKCTIITGGVLGIALLYTAWQHVIYGWSHTKHNKVNLTVLAINANFNSEKLNQQPFDPNIVKAFKNGLTKHADAKRNIALSLIDFGYLDLAINLYLSYQKVGLGNLLFVSSDSEACLALERRLSRVPCVQYLFDADAHLPSSYGSDAFFRKTHRKTKVVLDALRMDFNVLLVDVDIVLFKNPFPYLAKCDDCDLQVQWDNGRACSGFYFVRSSEAGIELLEKVWQYTLDKKIIDDQTSLNQAMETMNSKANYKQSILPEDIFPNGFAYFHKKKIMFVTDGEYPPNVYIVHDNWIISEAAKVYRFKESQMWFNDKGGYYSDKKRKYLTYRNAALDVSEVHQLEMDALKSALVIGRLLNRTVILPTFSCRDCKTSQFGACLAKAGRCSLLNRYKVEDLDRAFGDSYREHVFLMHPLVPKSVTQSESPRLLIRSQLNTKYTTGIDPTDLRDTVRLTPKSPSKGASVGEVVRWFSQYHDKSVLVLDTLYGAVNIKNAETALKGLKQKHRSAFKKSDYLQG